MKIPVLICLSSVKAVSGVTSWALRLKANFPANSKYDIKIVLCGGETVTPDVDHHAQTIDDIQKVLDSYSEEMIIIPNYIWNIFDIANLHKKINPNCKLVGYCRSDNHEEYYKPLEHYSPSIDSYISVSEECSDKLKSILGHPQKPFFTIPTGIKLGGPPTIKESDSMNICFAGRLDEYQKRAQDLIPFFSHLQQNNIHSTLSIAGYGSLLPDLKRHFAKSESVVKTELHGSISPERMSVFWKDQDIFVQFSEFEGTSNSMLEAMGNGVIPIVTHTESGVKGIINHNKNGFLFPIGKPEEAVKIIRSLHKNKQQLFELKSNAYNTSKEYSISRHIEKIIKAFDSAIKSKLAITNNPKESSPRFQGGYLPEKAPTSLNNSTDSNSISLYRKLKNKINSFIK